MNVKIIVATMVAIAAMKTVGQPLHFEADAIFAEASARKNDESKQQKKLIFRTGNVEIEISKGKEFPCVGLRITDYDRNWGCGTYMELKRREVLYLLSEDDEEMFGSIESAVESYIKHEIIEFYPSKEDGHKIWKTFVRDGGLRWFIKETKKMIDEEFLSSPFNTMYG